MTINGKDWLTIKEASELLLISRKSVRRLIQAGKLEARRVSYRCTLVNAESVKNYEYRGVK